MDFLKDVVHLYNGKLLSHIKEQSSEFAETQKDLETVIQSEVSQKEKNKYCIISLICAIQKYGTDELICKTEMKTQMQKTSVWILKREEVDGMNKKIDIDICTHYV